MKALILDAAAIELMRNVMNLSKLYSYRREYAVLNTDMINTATETASLVGELSHVTGELKNEYAYAAIKGLNKVKLLISILVDERLYSPSKAMPVIDFIDNIAAAVKVLISRPPKPPIARPVAPKPVVQKPQPKVVEVKKPIDDDGLDDDYFG